MKRASDTIKMMGTTIDLMIVHPQADQWIQRSKDLLSEYNHRFSANDADSELSQINQAAGHRAVSVHPELFELIALGKHHSLPSESSLNIAIGPLVQLWRIGFTDASVPSEDAIRAVLPLIDPHHIVLNENDHSVFLEKPGMAIDLGAIAKGYITDRLTELLKGAGVASALINLGGNLMTIGPALNREDLYWRIGIQKPGCPRGTALLALKTYNQSVVTSGIYERQLQHEGRTYHHIFDEQTGYPIENDIASISIVADHSVDCEIWTTRLFGKNHQEALRAIAQTDGIEGVVVTKEGACYTTPGIVLG